MRYIQYICLFRIETIPIFVTFRQISKFFQIKKLRFSLISELSLSRIANDALFILIVIY